MYSAHEEIKNKATLYISKGLDELKRSRTVPLQLAVQQLKSALVHFDVAAGQCQNHLANADFPALAQGSAKAHSAINGIESAIQCIQAHLEVTP